MSTTWGQDSVTAFCRQDFLSSTNIIALHPGKWKKTQNQKFSTEQFGAWFNLSPRTFIRNYQMVKWGNFKGANLESFECKGSIWIFSQISPSTFFHFESTECKGYIWILEVLPIFIWFHSLHWSSRPLNFCAPLTMVFYFKSIPTARTVQSSKAYTLNMKRGQILQTLAPHS